MLHFLLMCPRCPASASSHEVERFPEILKEAQKEGARLQKATEELRIIRHQIFSERSALTKLKTDREKSIRQANLDKERIDIAIAIHSLLKNLGISSGDMKNFILDITELNLDLMRLLKILREFKK